MKFARHPRWEWFLGVTLSAAGGCGLTNDNENAATKSIEPAKPAAAEESPHLGPGAIRCSRCHSDEDRQAPRWKEVAKKVGHNVDAMLSTRTTCNCCHLGEVKGFGEPIDRVCVQCHDNVRVTITGMGSMHCVSCHDPSSVNGAIIRESAWECQKCHAAKQGNHLAIDVHGGEDCTNCHRPHEEPWTLPRTCTDCHTANDTHHGEKEGASACDVCHRPHEVSGDAANRCKECHEKQKPGAFVHATFNKGHSCETCHDPHAAPNAAPRACASCHSNVHTMSVSARGSDKHGKCESCHTPHNIRTNPAQACATCHATITPQHPDPQGKSCTACHNPHPKEAKASTTLACNQCHDKAASETAFHAGTTRCKDCHTPHAFDKASVIPCKQCHEKETAASANGHGHGDCARCHSPHAPKEKPPACAQCHEKEHLTSVDGHLNCLQCHDNHPSNRVPKKSCNECHQKQTTGPHEHSDCRDCHRAHGPDAPAGPKGPAQKPSCVSCHNPSFIGSLHILPQHQNCSQCHTAHKAPKNDRVTCTSSCHEKQRTHEPSARVCSGCHAFHPIR